jgi:capsular polysaccharide biosynthesis protein
MNLASPERNDSTDRDARGSISFPGFNGFHPARAERLVHSLELIRSLKRFRGLALGIALMGFILSVVFLLHYWPVYLATTQIYIQPAFSAVSVPGVEMGWPIKYDPVTYDGYVQQQILTMTGDDVLKSALSKVPGFQLGSESELEALDRLRGSISVARVENSYEVLISARANDAQFSADLANAVAAAYIENAKREQRAGIEERFGVLSAEAERVKKQLDDDRTEQAALKIGEVGASRNPHRTDELADEVERLRNRYDQVNEELQNQVLETEGPEAAHVTSAAAAPEHPIADGVVPAALILFAVFLLFAVLIPVAAQKLDSRVYVASDIEKAVGFAPIAQLPDFNEVSKEVFEEQLLRLASAVEHALLHGDRKSCVFFGTETGTGVTTIAKHICRMLESMNCFTVLLDTAGGQHSTEPSPLSADSTEPITIRPELLVQPIAAEENTHEKMFVLADAAPLTSSGETEHLARNSDCVVVVVESGATTRAQLRLTSTLLKRLNATAVGYVLNRISPGNADAEFKTTLGAVEDYVKFQSYKRKAEPARMLRAEVSPQTARGAAVSVAIRDEIATTAAPVNNERLSALPTDLSAFPPGRPATSIGLNEDAQETQPVLARTESQPPHAKGPWWLAEAMLPMKSSTIYPAHWMSEGAGSSGDHAVRRAVKVPKPLPGAQDSRLSALRNLVKMSSESSGDAPAVKGAPVSDGLWQRSGRAPIPVHEPERVVPPQPGRQESVPPAARKSTLEIPSMPEPLPPRNANRHAQTIENRVRRDTWNDVNVLSAWHLPVPKKRMTSPPKA